MWQKNQSLNSVIFLLRNFPGHVLNQHVSNSFPLQQVLVTFLWMIFIQLLVSYRIFTLYYIKYIQISENLIITRLAIIMHFISYNKLAIIKLIYWQIQDPDYSLKVLHITNLYQFV